MIVVVPGPAQARYSAATPSVAPATTGPDSGAGLRSVTLVTGDRVYVRADGNPAGVVPGKGREGIRFSLQHKDGHLVVVPVDAAQLLAAGRLDERLFDVTTLLEFGYDDARRDDLPLLVGGPLPGARRAALASAGAAVAKELPSIRGVALQQAKREIGRFWEATTAAKGRARGLRSGVEAVWLDGLSRLTLDSSVPQIGAPAAYQAGFTGAGVRVAVLDSGIDTSHPDLAGKVVAAQDFLGEGLTTEDPRGHGTHVASIVAGSGAASSGQFTGVAYDADLVNGRVCNAAGACPDSAVIAGMEWAAATADADVVNMSLGWDDTEQLDPKEAAVNQLTAQYGTLFVVSAGNNGSRGPHSLLSPASADAALAVAAVTKQDVLASFSSRGPRIGDGALKPDIAAPGDAITAAFSSQSGGGPTQRYISQSGTSMSAPHVAGAAAVLKQQHPTWTAAKLKAALMGSAHPLAGVSAYAQGAGRVDLAQAITTVVTADPPSVSFGQPQWPHGDDPPVGRTVTFTNDGTGPVTLSLALAMTDPNGSPAPAGMFSLGSSSVALPAGGSAVVTVTADTSVAGPEGHYTGRVIGSVSGTEVVSVPVAVDREVESYDLTLRHIDRTGALTGSYNTVLTSLDDGQQYRRYDGDGQLTIRVPAGSYTFQSHIFTGDQFTALVQPLVTVTGNTVVDVDARLGQPLDITVDQAGARLAAGLLGYVRYTTSGFLVDSWQLSGALDKNFTAHLGPVLTGNDIVTELSVVLAEPGPGSDLVDSPYAYHLAWLQEGQFLTGVDEDIDDSELASFDVDYATQGETQRYGLHRASTRPPGPGAPLAGLSAPFVALALPTSRTELYSTQDVQWAIEFYETAEPFNIGSIVTGQQHMPSGVFSPGSSAEKWNFGPVMPGLLSADTYRAGDDMHISLPAFSDQSGHYGFSSTTSGRTALYREGTLVGESGSPGSANFAVPAALADYELRIDAARDVSDLSTSIEAVWAFESQSVPVFPRTPLPLMGVRFLPELDGHNAAPAGTVVSFPAVVDRQPGSATPAVSSFTVDVSYDDGQTWQPASVSGSAGSYQVTLNHPAGNGYVSLRAHASDTAGGTLDQTVIRAYRIAGGELPPPVELRAQYQVGNASSVTNQISNVLQVTNDGDDPVALSDVQVRYWYTADGTQPQQYNCDYAPIGCSSIAGGFTTLGSPRPGADTYLELSFTGGTLPAGGGSTGGIQNRWHKNDWSNYQQTGDYSFDPAETALTDWSKVTVYYQGQLVWGTEP